MGLSTDRDLSDDRFPFAWAAHVIGDRPRVHPWSEWVGRPILLAGTNRPKYTTGLPPDPTQK